jgi:hypothetical protein
MSAMRCHGEPGVGAGSLVLPGVTLLAGAGCKVTTTRSVEPVVIVTLTALGAPPFSGLSSRR